ncbi:MAG: hypothetical protein IJU86_02520 [Firmicutes bacterium]|nr:hypothetical protein [Bacillota bacterium]
MSELQISKEEIDFEEKIKFETRKKIEQEKEASCCCLFLGKIKSFWDWFYSGRIRVSIDLFLLMWEKLTFVYNCVDLLAMITTGAIKFLLPSAVHEFVLLLAIPAMEILISLKFIIPALIVLFYFAKWVNVIPDKQKVKQQIKEDDDAYKISLRSIHKNGFFSSAGIKFVWEKFKGRLFDFVVTSMFLVFMNLSGAWFVLYCIFVVWGAVGIIKDIILARYDYCCLVNDKFKSECSKFTKSTVEYAKHKHGQYFANYDDKPKQKTIDNENKK